MSRPGLQAGARVLARRLLRPLVGRLVPVLRQEPPARWRLTRGPTGALVLDGVPLEDLLARFGSPLHVVDGARLAENAARFLARPAGAAAACEVCYSYKTNPVPGVLRRLHRLGVGAEVVSAYELWLALRLGVAPSAIVYNGPAKSADSVAQAVALEIGLLNLNARSELAAVAAAARRAGQRPRVGLRVTVPGGWAGQFGERIDTGAALEAFRQALALPELRVVALHAHLGGEIAARPRLDAFLSGLLGFADELRARLGLELEALDLGGSLACPTVSRHAPRRHRLAAAVGLPAAPRPPGAVLSIEAYLARIRERVEGHYAAAGRPVPRVILEPGRALTGDAQLLLCRVLQVRDPDATGLAWAVLDAGVNLAEAVRGEFHQLFALAPRPAAPRRSYRLAGPTCTPGDVLYGAWPLPTLEPGDGLAIMDAGAYFIPSSTAFSFPRPGVALVEGGGARLIRRPESFEDLVDLDLPEDAP
jgi:diaminopimelate decarboxylase